MKPMNIFALHCDTMMPVYIDGHTLRNWTGHINLDKMQQGGAMVQCFAIYIPTNRSAEYHNVKEGPYEYWQGCVNAFDPSGSLHCRHRAEREGRQDVRSADR